MLDKSNNSSATDLNDNTLDHFNILKPKYNRSALSPGIVHIGVGNFHRAHMSWYIHQLMQKILI